MLKLAERFPPMQGEKVFAIAQNMLLPQRRLGASQSLIQLFHFAGHRHTPGVDGSEPSKLLPPPGDDGGIATIGPLRQVCDQVFSLHEKLCNLGGARLILIY
jgi:hypothetical protein